MRTNVRERLRGRPGQHPPSVIVHQVGGSPVRCRRLASRPSSPAGSLAEGVAPAGNDTSPSRTAASARAAVRSPSASDAASPPIAGVPCALTFPAMAVRTGNRLPPHRSVRRVSPDTAHRLSVAGRVPRWRSAVRAASAAQTPLDTGRQIRIRCPAAGRDARIPRKRGPGEDCEQPGFWCQRTPLGLHFTPTVAVWIVWSRRPLHPGGKIPCAPRREGGSPAGDRERRALKRRSVTLRRTPDAVSAVGT